jgi:tRNA threonylcarbamoyladenosine biosynthesis protein TsaB
MKILAFDSSGAACSVAAAVGGRPVVRRHEPMERGHAERLMPMIRDTLSEAGVTPRDLDLVTVAVGPGTFTGIRIALAAARGLALAAGVPVFGVTGFEAVAATLPAAERRGRRLLVALDSRRGDAFVQLFEGDAAVRGPEPVIFADLPRWLAGDGGPLLVAGDAAAPAVAALAAAGLDAAAAPGASAIDAAAMLRLAAERWRRGERPPPPAPLYLRAPSVTLAPPR